VGATPLPAFLEPKEAATTLTQTMTKMTEPNVLGQGLTAILFGKPPIIACSESGV
jgi:hypothetical protein